MADNLTFQSATPATAPDATVVRTDDLGAAGHVQYVKLMDGTNNGTDPIGGDAANGLDVDVTRVQGSVAVTNAALTTLAGAVYAEDLASSNADPGIQILTVRKNTAAATSGTDGDYQPLITDTNGRLHVLSVVSGTVTVDGSGVTQPISGTVTANGQYTEDAVAPGDPSGTGIVLRQRATPTDAGAAAGDWVTADGTKYGAQYVQVITSAGAHVDSFGGGTQFAEDIAHTTGDVGTLVLARRADTASSSSGTDGDYSTFNVDANGRLHVTGPVFGPTASGSAVSAAPVTRGGLAKTANPTAVADGQVVNALHDKLGKTVVVASVRDLKVVQTTTITSSTSETTILTAGAAGVFHDLNLLTCTNTSTTGTKVTLRDATAGSAVQVLYCPPLSTVGINPYDPLKQTTAANNWTLTCGTSVAGIEVTVQAVKNL